jgi:hypothetical protein
MQQGRVTLDAEWTTTPDVWAGRLISMVAAFFLALLGLLERRFKRFRPAHLS